LSFAHRRARRCLPRTDAERGSAEQRAVYGHGQQSAVQRAMFWWLRAGRGPHADTHASSNHDTHPNTRTDTDADPHANRHTDTDANGDTDPHANPDPDPDPDPHADTDSDTDAKPDGDTNADTHATALE